MNWWRSWKKKRYGELIPTDKEIFELVYEKYYLKFMNFDKENNKTRITKNYVPIYQRLQIILVLIMI